jgi:tRNA A-37 threonylcarbamoyl transferase component Bud32/tetratricopeptide (TPR) repeat protein
VAAEPQRGDEPTVTVVGERIDDAPAAAPATGGRGLAAGDAVGRFSILRRVGVGGNGEVFAAYDPVLDRKVAVKVLRTRAAGMSPAEVAEHTARLLREARVLAQLRHPAIVSVYEVGTHDGRVFIAMEYVTGTTLAAWLRAEVRDWRAIREVMLAAGDGLAVAHAAGLVHRDFKPHNVMLEEGGRVVVLDFGLARPADGASSTPTAASVGDVAVRDHCITVGGAVPGTLPYMAPELFGGISGDARSDQFSFCVTFYEALYGVRPFVAAGPREHVAVVSSGPEFPAAAGPHVPAWCRALIERGLAADPSARFASLAALLRALRRDRHRHRKRLLAGVAALVLAAAAGGGVSLGWEATLSAEQAERIDAIAAQAREAADRGHYLVPPLHEPDGATALARILELEAIEGAAAARSHRAAAELRAELATALVSLGESYAASPEAVPFAADFFVAARVFDPDNEVARANAPVTDAQLAALQRAVTDAAFTPAQRLAHEPLAILADREPRRRAQKLASFVETEGAPARTCDELRSVVGASPPARKVQPRRQVEATPSSPPPEAPPVAEATPAAAPAPVPAPEDATRRESTVDPAASREASAAGHQARTRGDFATATTKFHRALQLDPRNRSALEGLAEVAFQQNEPTEAVGYLRKALRLAPRNQRLHLQLGDAYLAALDYPRALAAYRTAAELGSRKAADRIALVEARTGARPRQLD